MKARIAEEWRDVIGYKGLYQVSSLGRVRAVFHNPPRVLKASTDGRYCVVGLSKGGGYMTRRVHNLVAEAFIGPRPVGQVTRHRDGNGHNNRRGNIEYGTQQENVEDKFRHGTILYGAAHQNCLVSDEQVREILALKKGEIGPWADANGFSRGHVYNIRAGHRRATAKD